MSNEQQLNSSSRSGGVKGVAWWRRQPELVDANGAPRKYSALHQQLLQSQPEPARRAYITSRWLDAVIGARSSMKRDQRRFRRGSFVTLGAAAVSPVVVTATAATAGALRSTLTIVAVCTSLIAAIGGVLVQTLRPDVRWRLHRMLRDDLEALAWAYLTALARHPATARTAPAAPAGADPWDAFVAGVERAIVTHNAVYAQEVAGVLGTRPAGEPAAGGVRHGSGPGERAQ